MRDLRQTITALERKAADPACAGPEADALLAKVAELRAKLPTRPSVADADGYERIRANIQSEWESLIANFGASITVTYAGPGENMTPAEARRGAPRWVRWNGRFD